MKKIIITTFPIKKNKNYYYNILYKKHNKLDFKKNNK